MSLAIKTEKKKNNNKKKKDKELKEYLECAFIRIDPDEDDFSAYDGLRKIQTFTDKLKDE